ncbi:MAG: hypothetical protein WBK20_10950 [Spirochaetota bacterium]
METTKKEKYLWLTYVVSSIILLILYILLDFNGSYKSWQLRMFSIIFFVLGTIEYINNYIENRKYNVLCPNCNNEISIINFLKAPLPWNLKCNICKKKIKIAEFEWIICIITVIIFYGLYLIFKNIHRLNVNIIEKMIYYIIVWILIEYIIYFLLLKKILKIIIRN